MLTYNKTDFLMDGKKFNIYSGAIHYFRTLPEYWEDRLSKLKAAGFNTVETYIAWDLHERSKGKFDFEGRLDFINFLKIAQNLGLYAILRPGPYICAEWDFGGLPAWLLADPKMHVRTSYQPYLDHVRDYFEVIIPMIAEMQTTRGGNVIAVQVENEYGSYSCDKNYLKYVEKMLLDNGIDVLLFTSDGTWGDFMEGGYLPHVFKTANFGSSIKHHFAGLRKYQPEGPLMCAEMWCGWFDQWGGRKHKRPAFSVTREVKKFLDLNASFSMYMFHGGTNFGFTSGANFYSKYCPTVTSYDYGAPLNEAGCYTPLYHKLRKLLLEKQNLPFAPLPPEVEFQEIGAVRLDKQTTLFDNLDALSERFESAAVGPMEYFGQNHGLILYKYICDCNYGGAKLRLDDVHDIAHVFVNGQYKGKTERNKNVPVLLGSIKAGDEVSVLVDALGRVNYGHLIHDRKGISGMRINRHVLANFTVHTIPLERMEKVDYSRNESQGPKILKGSFKAATGKDCYIHTDGFTKGVIYINGFNLGRYWKIGPQRSLYIPGSILKDVNEIVVVEMESFASPQVTIKAKS